MPTNVFDGDVIIRGSVVANTNIPSDNSITTAKIAAAANLNADKLEQRLHKTYSQPNTAATSETRGVFVARKTGIINELAVGSIAIAVGAATVTCDLRKNGTTILTGVVTLNSSSVARVVQTAGFSGVLNQFVAGDFFEIVLVATAGGGTLPTGVFVQLEIDQLGV